MCTVSSEHVFAEKEESHVKKSGSVDSWTSGDIRSKGGQELLSAFQALWVRAAISSS